MTINMLFRRQIKQWWCDGNRCEDRNQAGYRGSSEEEWQRRGWILSWVGEFSLRRAFDVRVGVTGGRAQREGGMAKRCSGMLLGKKYLSLKKNKCGYFLKKEEQRQRYILFVSLAHYGEIHNSIYLFRKKFHMVSSLGFSCS